MGLECIHLGEVIHVEEDFDPREEELQLSLHDRYLVLPARPHVAQEEMVGETVCKDELPVPIRGSNA